MFNVILKISVIGAHSNFAAQGFRQTDVRFIAELLSNWLDVFLKPEFPSWHNTQALRYLEQLISQSLATANGRGKKKRYRLTRMGLIQLVQEVVEVQGYSDFRYVLFTYYFLRAYRRRVMGLIRQEGSGYSKALQMELEHLFDHSLYLSKNKDAIKQQIQRLEIRIIETEKAAQMAIRKGRQGEPVDQIIDQVSLSYPYELENQKPMSELFKEIEPEMRFWEMSQGNQFRAQVLWKSQLSCLRKCWSTLI